MMPKARCHCCGQHDLFPSAPNIRPAELFSMSRSVAFSGHACALICKERKAKAMMYGNGMASGMGAMMWGMGLLWLLVVVLIVLGVAALAKYVFFGGNHKI